MAGKKRGSRGKHVKVQLDAVTAHKLEALLREGLVSSAAVEKGENTVLPPKPGGPKKVSVKLSPRHAARLSELLRKGLSASRAVDQAENRGLDRMTKRVKGKC